MRRILLFLSGTATVVSLLFGYHTSTGGSVPMASPVISAGTAAAATSGNAGSGGTTDTGGTDATATRTVTGPTVQTQWGPVQVQLTMSGDSIADVSVLQYPSSNSKDQQINSYALPILVRSTLDRQSAEIDMVSGATVTSGGYLQSLQAALDSAGV